MFSQSYLTSNWEWLNLLIVVAYYLIPTMLVYSLYKGRNVPFQWMFLVFGGFFVASGSTHVMVIWEQWYPGSWILNLIKIITIMVSGGSTLLLLTLMPFALSMPSPAKLEAANLALENEIIKHKETELALQKLTSELEKRVKERTARLTKVNQSLKRQIHARRNAQRELKEQTTQLANALEELKQTQAQLVQTEKMSSLGQLVAGVAHEINNPVNFINGNLEYANNYAQDLLQLVQLYQQHYPQPIPEIQKCCEEIDFDFIIADFPKMLASMKLGTDRICQIVQALRNFSRAEQLKMKPVDIHEGINSTLLILNHRLKARGENPGIEVIKEYDNLPPVECYDGQLKQGFMNILANAIDALEESAVNSNAPAKIRIRTELKSSLNKNSIVISIGDNGLGMREETRAKIFDPFFTTKPVGKGTGLGLSISYQIVVEKHGGQLRCIAAPGGGTEFLIEIPITQKQLIANTASR